jgi:hypothetical protein
MKLSCCTTSRPVTEIPRKLDIVDQSEQRALWNLCTLLERELVEPLDPNYGDLLAAARDRLRDTAE